MKRFLTQIVVFIIPLVILFGVPTYILFKSKESFYTIDKILASNEKYMIGYAYNEINYGYLKWSYLNCKAKKEVWALGSSRVLQFRENMFDATFYNAGYTITSMNDFRPFLNSLPFSTYPKYLIIGLDQWMFNSSYDNLTSTPSKDSWQYSFIYIPDFSTNYKTIYADLYEGKFNLSYLVNQTNTYTKIGLNAVMKNTGFRNDGSMYYGDQIDKLINNDSSANDFRYSNTFDRIEQGNRRFQYADQVNDQALRELDKLLNDCKVKNINVVAFLPPFANAVHDKMMDSGRYNYLKEVYSKSKSVFDKYAFELYDYSTVISCNSNDNETIDGFHGGEVTYQKLLISMLNSGSVLNKVANKKRLEADLNAKKNNYIVYDY